MSISGVQGGQKWGSLIKYKAHVGCRSLVSMSHSKDHKCANLLAQIGWEALADTLMGILTEACPGFCNSGTNNQSQTSQIFNSQSSMASLSFPVSTSCLLQRESAIKANTESFYAVTLNDSPSRLPTTCSSQRSFDVSTNRGQFSWSAGGSVPFLP